MAVFLNAPSVSLVENFISLFLFNLLEITSLVIKMAENKEVKIPIISVVANRSALNTLPSEQRFPDLSIKVG